MRNEGARHKQCHSERLREESALLVEQRILHCVQNDGSKDRDERQRSVIGLSSLARPNEPYI